MPSIRGRESDLLRANAKHGVGRVGRVLGEEEGSAAAVDQIEREDCVATVERESLSSAEIHVGNLEVEGAVAIDVDVDRMQHREHERLALVGGDGERPHEGVSVAANTGRNCGGVDADRAEVGSR